MPLTQGVWACRSRALALCMVVGTLGVAAGAALGQDEPEIAGVAWLDGQCTQRFDIVLDGLARGALPERLLVGARDADNYLELSFPGGKVRLERVLGGVRTRLGEADLPSGFADQDLVVQWRLGRVRVIAGHQALIVAYEHGLTGGRAGFAGDIGDAEIWLQPVEEVYFADDYGRGEGEYGAWKREVGDWSNVQSEGEAGKSANPFAFEGKSRDNPGDYALATIGSDFWSDYYLESAVFSSSARAIGLAALCGGAGADGRTTDYVLVRWTSQLASGPDADRLQLIAVRGQERTVLAEKPEGYLPDQWYRLRLEAGRKDLAVKVDGREVLRVPTTAGFGRGRIGLYAEGPEGVRYDDTRAGPLAPGTFSFPEDLDACIRMPSVGVEGNPAAMTADGRGGLAILPELLRDADVTLDLARVGKRGEALLGYRGEGNHWAVAWEAGKADNVRIVRRDSQGETTLARASCALAPTDRAKVRVLALDDLIRVQVNGTTILETADEIRMRRLDASEDSLEEDMAPDETARADDEALEAAPGEDSGPAAANPVGRVGIRFAGDGAAHLASMTVAIPRKPKAATLTEQFTRETTTMKEWATVSGSWIDPGSVPYANGVSWNKGDYSGDVEVRVTFTSAEGEGQSSVIMAAEDWDPASGYAFRFTQSGSNAHVGLYRQDALVGEASVEDAALPATWSLRMRGRLLTAALGSRIVLSVTDPDPLRGTKVGLLEAGLSVDHGSTYAIAAAEDDYTFSNAPAEWYAQTGTWELSSRWTCSPEWSWWSGLSEEGAVMWSKAAYSDDLTVELYSSLKMGITRAGSGYKHPHDLNITICGDGSGIGSGYSFVLGGYLDSKTQIWKGPRLLAETDDPLAMLPRMSNGMPTMNDFHRKWWQIRAEKQGGRLRLYLDNRLVLEAYDSDPLGPGHVAIWTWDNGVMVARVKVYGEATGEVLVPRATRDRAIARAQETEAPAIAVSSPTHPAIVWDFERGRGEFATFRRVGLAGPGAERYGGIEQGAVLVLDQENPAEGSRCLKLVNEHPGGNFGAFAILRDFKPSEYGWLGFDYRIGPLTRVDIWLVGATRDYMIGFTGGLPTPPGVVRLGDIEGVQADGNWHRADFDIRGHMVNLGYDPGSETITEVHIGNFVPDKLLALGVTGNPRGATWWLDNFGVYSAGPAVGQFAWDAVAGAASHMYAISKDPGTDPTEVGTQLQSPAVEVADLPPGPAYLHITTLGADGTQLATVHHRFVTAAGSPRIAGVLPAEGAAVAGGRVAIEVGDAGPGIVPSSVRVIVSGAELDLSTSAVALDAVRNRIAVDLDALPDTALANGRVEVSLASAATYAGQAVSGGPFLFTLSRSLDVTPPKALRVIQTGAYAINDTFEEGVGLWQPVPGERAQGAAALALDSTTAAAGKSSLAITKRDEGGSYVAWATTQGFDAGRHRLLSFDYRIAPWVRIDMVLTTSADGKQRLIKMTDNDQDGHLVAIGRAPIVADGEWHHVELDLLPMLIQSAPTLGDYRVAQLGFCSGGWDGNPKGTVWHIDNFRLASVASSRDRLLLHWTAEDSSGIAGASYVLDDQPDTEPDTLADTEATYVAIEPPIAGGWRWLHLRLVDGAGNWSETLHHRFYLDGTSPVATGSNVKQGGHICTDKIEITIADPGGDGSASGVDPRSVRLRVGSETYSVDNPALTFAANSGLLLWDGQRNKPRPRTFADGESVAVVLEACSDYAGNPLSSVFAANFVMDYSLDASPPDRPLVVCQSHPLATFEPFETHLGMARGVAETEVALDSDAVSAEATESVADRLGTSCLRMTRSEGTAFAARLYEEAVDIATYPYLTFDYRCPPETKADLVLNIAGRDVVVTFTDGEAGAARQVPGATADGVWRRATVQLIDVARAAVGDQRSYLLRSVSVADLGNLQTPVGSSLWIDNLLLVRGGQGAVQCSWRAFDPTGIEGYSWVLDTVPYTVPPEQVTGKQQKFESERPAPGVQYLHVRAVDGAGHWSDTRHIAIVELP